MDIARNGGASAAVRQDAEAFQEDAVGRLDRVKKDRALLEAMLDVSAPQETSAYNLLGILNDLLDFSKIEAGKLELVPSDFSLRGAVGDTLRALPVRAHKKGLELIYQVQPDVPDALVGDAGRLRQVLFNLVGNAVKFTDEGEVVVYLEIQGDGPPPSPGAGDVGLRFTVRDTGIGIPPGRADARARRPRCRRRR